MINLKFATMRFIIDIYRLKNFRPLDFIKALWWCYIRPNKEMKRAMKRYEICTKCVNYSNDMNDCAIRLKMSVPCCKICGCSLRLKIFSEHGCDLKKW